MKYSPYEEKECLSVRFEYQPSMSDGKEIFGEEWKSFDVGKKGVVSIHEHHAAGDGDKWFFDVVFEDKTMIRIFHPHAAYYKLP